MIFSWSPYSMELFFLTILSETLSFSVSNVSGTNYRGKSLVTVVLFADALAFKHLNLIITKHNTMLPISDALRMSIVTIEIPSSVSFFI